MPTTTIHVSDVLLSAIDKAAKENQRSRNRFIVEACEKALTARRGDWPKRLFDPGYKKGDLELLREGVSEMEGAILTLRKNRKRLMS
jgi:hypothetical protein